MDDPRTYNPNVKPHGALTGWCSVCGWVFPWHACEVVRMTDAEQAEAIAELEAVTSEHPAILEQPTADPATGEGGQHAGWYCGTFRWRTPTGWIVEVFNDCGEWDYLESIEAPDGRRWSFPLNMGGRRITHAMTEPLKDWKPSNELGWPGIEHCSP